MLTQKTNFHRHKLPKIGEIGKLIMSRNKWNEPQYYLGIKSNWICTAYNVCDSADYRYSLGIHLAYFRSLQYPKLTIEISGIYFEN